MDTHEMLKVHHRNPKTGKVISEIPYRLHFSGDQKLFEKPAGSNQWYFESGEVAPKELHPSLPPKVYKLTQDQELAHLKAENAYLKSNLQLSPVVQEIASIEQEQAKFASVETKKAMVKDAKALSQ